jgi:hypothetical protein
VIEDVEVKHIKERLFFKKALTRVHDKLAQKVAKIMGRSDEDSKSKSLVTIEN